MGVLGMLVLMWSASVYSAYGLSAYPRQEWLIETLASVLFVIPVVNVLRGVGTLRSQLRWVGALLIAHSLWDALHWPAAPLIQTPIDPWIPELLPWLELPLGAYLLVRGG
jgi:hypothetical protein